MKINYRLILLSFLFSSLSFASEEIWIHFNPEYKLDRFDFRPELHLRENLTNSMKTKALKMNFVADQLVLGAAYFDFSDRLNERRGYTGWLYTIHNWSFRNLIELRDFNNTITKWRARSKFDFQLKAHIILSSELLYQTGLTDMTELRTGIAFRTQIGKKRFSILPSLISSQRFKTRYVLMIGEYF